MVMKLSITYRADHAVMHVYIIYCPVGIQLSTALHVYVHGLQIRTCGMLKTFNPFRSEVKPYSIEVQTGKLVLKSFSQSISNFQSIDLKWKYICLEILDDQDSMQLRARCMGTLTTIYRKSIILGANEK